MHTSYSLLLLLLLCLTTATSISLAADKVMDECDFEQPEFKSIEANLTSCEKAAGTNLTGLIVAPTSLETIETLCSCTTTVQYLKHTPLPACNFTFDSESVTLSDHFAKLIKKCPAASPTPTNSISGNKTSGSSSDAGTIQLPTPSTSPTGNAQASDEQPVGGPPPTPRANGASHALGIPHVAFVVGAAVMASLS